MKRKGTLIAVLAVVLGLCFAAVAQATWNTCVIKRIGVSGGKGVVQFSSCPNNNDSLAANVAMTLSTTQLNQQLAVMLTAFANGKNATVFAVPCSSVTSGTCLSGTSWYITILHVDQ